MGTDHILVESAYVGGGSQAFIDLKEDFLIHKNVITWKIPREVLWYMVESVNTQ